MRLVIRGKLTTKDLTPFSSILLLFFSPTWTYPPKLHPGRQHRPTRSFKRPEPTRDPIEFASIRSISEPTLSLALHPPPRSPWGRISWEYPVRKRWTKGGKAMLVARPHHVHSATGLIDIPRPLRYISDYPKIPFKLPIPFSGIRTILTNIPTSSTAIRRMLCQKTGYMR